MPPPFAGGNVKFFPARIGARYACSDQGVLPLSKRLGRRPEFRKDLGEHTYLDRRIASVVEASVDIFAVILQHPIPDNFRFVCRLRRLAATARNDGGSVKRLHRHKRQPYSGQGLFHDRSRPSFRKCGKLAGTSGGSSTEGGHWFASQSRLWKPQCTRSDVHSQKRMRETVDPFAGATVRHAKMSFPTCP
jgi:hypothetical protein